MAPVIISELAEIFDAQVPTSVLSRKERQGFEFVILSLLLDVGCLSRLEIRPARL